MLPQLKNAADAMASAARSRATQDDIFANSLRRSGDPSRLAIDSLLPLVERYEEKPNQRTADMLAKAICRLIRQKILDQRGRPADEYLSYVQIRMEREMDPLGAFERLASQPTRVR